jgi:hypothetical protein
MGTDTAGLYHTRSSVRERVVPGLHDEVLIFLELELFPQHDPRERGRGAVIGSHADGTSF